MPVSGRDDGSETVSLRSCRCMRALGLTMREIQDAAAEEPSGAQDMPQDDLAHDSLFDPGSILASIGEVVYSWNLNSDELTWGPTAAHVLGRLARTHTGREYVGHVEPASGRSPHEAISESAERDSGTGVAYRTRYILRQGRDELLAVEDSGRWFANVDGFPAMAHGVLRVERLGAPGLSATMARGPTDRASFVARVDEELADARSVGRPLCLIVAAIADLGRLCDIIGDEGGDAVIETVMARMRASMRGRDILSRYAGNRYGALLLSCTPEQAPIAAARIADSVALSPIETVCGTAAARVALGGAIFPLHAQDAATLLRRAEEALAGARGDGNKAFRLYTPAPLAAPARRAQSAQAGQEIVAALNERRVVLARQPIVDAQTREVAFEEGLLRLRRHDGSIAGAAEIVPAVEKLGLVRLVDHRVLEIATEHLAENPQSRLAINISPVTLADPAWLDMLAAHLGARPGIAERMIVEIVETAAIDDPVAMRARLDCMKALGVSIGIDDFGSGHTSFRHLRSFPIDLLKIDGAFVQNLTRVGNDRFFVRTLVDLAQNLGIATVAEWVECEATATLLASWGVDYLQGDYLGTPRIDGAEAEVARGSEQSSRVA